MRAHHLRHLRADAAHRVEGEGGILEHDRDLGPAHAPQLGRPAGRAARRRATGWIRDHARARRKETEEGEEERGLPAAGFAEKADGLALLDAEGDVPGREDAAPPGVVRDGEVRDLEQSRHPRMIGRPRGRPKFGIVAPPCTPGPSYDFSRVGSAMFRAAEDGPMMAQANAGSGHEHFREEDWLDFAREVGDREHRARVAQHLEAGCSECEQTFRAVGGGPQRRRPGDAGRPSGRSSWGG